MKNSVQDKALSRHDNLSGTVSEVKQEGLETVPRFPGQFHLRKSENWHEGRNIRVGFAERILSHSFLRYSFEILSKKNHVSKGLQA
jgi:hypothetical protein